MVVRNAHLLFFLCFAGLTSCAPHLTLPTGVYIESNRPGRSLATNKELRLYPNQQFAYWQWTDMVGTGGQGQGSYHLSGKQLILEFDGRPVESMTIVQERPLAASPDADSVSVQVYLLWKKEAASGLTVLAVDKTGGTLAGVSSSLTGQGLLRLARSQHPQRLVITGIGFKRIEQPWPQSSTAYRIQLAATLGPTYKAGVKLSFRVLHQSPTELIMCQGADTIKLRAASRP